MQDCFNRNIEYLRVSLTAKCNLRCVYCMPENGCIVTKETLTFDEFWRLIKLICKTGIKKIRLTGGEPLLYSNLLDLIRKIKNSTQIEEIALTTNGILLENKVEMLKKAGIDSINLSLDCLDKDLFFKITRDGDINSVLAGIDKACTSGIKLKINSVILKDINETEIIPLVNFAQKNNILLRFIELMPINAAQNYQGVDEVIILDKLTQFFGKAELILENNSPAHYYNFADLKVPVGFISAMSHKFCAKCNRIRLTSVGFLKPCLHDNRGLDLKSLLKKGTSDEELMQKIKKTIYTKPQCHHLNDVSFAQKETQSMSLIGG